MDKRKRLISIAAMILLTALLTAPFFSRESRGVKSIDRSFAEYEEFESITIYLATDTHYIAPSLTDGGEYYSKMIRRGDGKFMPYCSEINEAFINKVIEDKPAVLILAGDLTFNGAKESHLEYSKMLERVEAAGIPVLAIPGNHDFTLKRAARFSGDSYELVPSIDASKYLELYGDFGRIDSYDFDGTSLSYVYEVAPNLRILCVDVNTVAGMSGILTPGTLEFVEEQLIKAKEDKAYVISVTHQTLLVHSELTSRKMTFINNDKLLDLYEKYGVVMNLSGHMHIQHIAVSEGGVPDISTGSLMTSPNYYARLTFEGKKISYRAVPLEVDAVPDFAEKSHQFLWENAYRQGSEGLEGAASDELSSFFADFNVSYIAGRSDLIEWDPDILKKWDKTDSFVPYYFQLVQEEGPQNYTTYDLELVE
jgi:predicted MPP superfamily phosphohydrolase